MFPKGDTFGWGPRMGVHPRRVGDPCMQTHFGGREVGSSKMEGTLGRVEGREGGGWLPQHSGERARSGRLRALQAEMGLGFILKALESRAMTWSHSGFEKITLLKCDE